MENLSNPNKIRDFREIAVPLPYGELVAQVGGDEINYPEIFVFLRRPDGIEIDLTAVSMDMTKSNPILQAYLWSDIYNEDWQRCHNFGSLKNFEELEIE